MVHALPVKVKSAMLNIAEQLGIRNARRNGLRPYRTRNNSGGSSAEETPAGQCRRFAGHGPVSITGRRPEPGGMVGAISVNAQNPLAGSISENRGRPTNTRFSLQRETIGVGHTPFPCPRHRPACGRCLIHFRRLAAIRMESRGWLGVRACRWLAGQFEFA